MKTTQVPKDLQSFFASAPVENLDVDRDKKYIIHTLLQKSNLFGWRWLIRTYTPADIHQVIVSSKQLKPKDVFFWARYLSIPLKDILCLRTKFPNTLKSSWKY